MGFNEVLQATNAVSGIVKPHEGGAGTVFRPRNVRQVIGAEVDHEEKVRARAREAFRPHRQSRLAVRPPEAYHEPPADFGPH